MTNEAIKKREELQSLINACGYKSIRELCKEVGITAPNLYSNITGKYKISTERMFKIAQVLNVPILQIIEIFYPEELAKNQSLF